MSLHWCCEVGLPGTHELIGRAAEQPDTPFHDASDASTRSDSEHPSAARASGTVLPPRERHSLTAACARAVKTLEPSAHTTVGAKPDLCRSVLLSMASLALIEQGYVEVIGQHHSTCKLRFLLTGEIPEGATESIYGHGEHMV